MRKTGKSMLRMAALCAVLLLAMCFPGLAETGDATPTKLAEQVRQMAQRLEALEEERALDIRLNRSDLENLSIGEGPIYVTGHKSPDSDTVCSAILYARLLNALGYEAIPCTLGPISRETRYILEQAGVEAPEILEDASGLNMVLVDHSEYAQSADGLENANVIAIIDHHGDGSVTTGNPLVYDARPIGSTATIVWLRYRSYGVEVDAQAATLIVGAILSDTSGLKSDMTSTADREAVKRYSEALGIDTDALYAEIYKASISYDGMTDAEIFDSDVKDYECGGTRYTIGCMNAYDEDGARELADRMAAILPDMAAARGTDMAYAQISIYHDDISISYLVASNEAAVDALKEAFGDKLEFDGVSYILRPGVSRKKTLVPALNAVLENHPKE